MMRVLGHIARVAAGLFLLIGLPLIVSGRAAELLSGKADAVSSATAVMDQPSGEYVILINRDIHSDPAALEAWKAFFAHGDTDGIVGLFEDISCTVSSSDPAGLEAAKSYISRLPENQMKLRTEDCTLMLSKAEHGRFDVIVMSKEAAESGKARRAAELANTEIVCTKGEPS